MSFRDDSEASPAGGVPLVAIPPALDGSRERALAEALDSLGLVLPSPVLVVVGGAARLAAGAREALGRPLERLSPVLDDLGVIVVDGGTASGVMAAMGEARAAAGASFPLLGVAAAGTVASAARPPGARCAVIPGADPSETGAELEPNHSHFLLVPGDAWGDESAWISAAAARLAGTLPSLTLVAGGGEITRRDLGFALGAGRPLIVLAGTGGVSDRVTGLPPSAGHPSQIQVVDLDEAVEALPAILASRLRP